MRRLSFEALSNELATTRGGFTLWIGAGASVAATGGRTPTWSGLVAKLGGAASNADFPERLEELSQRLTHAAFRRRLREELIDTFAPATLDHDTLVNQAILGARAGSVVSFNIEYLSALPFSLLRGSESFIPRTFRERAGPMVNPIVDTSPGLIGSPVYFPHGLLLQGTVVMTKSEYDRHLGSVAMATAVHLCIGADLVIVGMSLGDSYLRKAILENRRWIRDIFWIGDTTAAEHCEWARVASVTRVHVVHSEMWRGLANAILRHDANGTLTNWILARRDQLPGFMESLWQHHAEHPNRLAAKARQLASAAEADTEELRVFADFCVDCGYDVPIELATRLEIFKP